MATVAGHCGRQQAGVHMLSGGLFRNGKLGSGWERMQGVLQPMRCVIDFVVLEICPTLLAALRKGKQRDTHFNYREDQN